MPRCSHWQGPSHRTALHLMWPAELVHIVRSRSEALQPSSGSPCRLRNLPQRPHAPYMAGIHARVHVCICCCAGVGAAAPAARPGGAVRRVRLAALPAHALRGAGGGCVPRAGRRRRPEHADAGQPCCSQRAAERAAAAGGLAGWLQRQQAARPGRRRCGCWRQRCGRVAWATRPDPRALVAAAGAAAHLRHAR